METTFEQAASKNTVIPKMSIDLLGLCMLQKSFFTSGTTLPISFRKAQLQKLRELIKENDAAIVEALYLDLHKSEFESFGSEIGQVLKEIDHTISNLNKWASPKSVPTPLMFFPSTSKVYPDPLGNTLIIGPWNYPFLLLMSPLVSAIAGGNTIVLKASEEASHTANLIENIISKTFDEKYIAVIQGIGAEVIPEIIGASRFDHIFFTGSTVVGQKIMEMASKWLVRCRG